MTETKKKYEEKNRTAIYVRCTQEEYDQITADEKTTGLSAPALLKRRYFQGKSASVLLPPEERKEWFTELKRWGNNLNQVARKVNSGIMGGWQAEILEIYRMLASIENKVVSVYGSSRI